MTEKSDLKPMSKIFEELGIDVDNIDVNEGDEVIIKEVCRKGDLILYEYDDEDIGQTVSHETASEMFPEYELDPRKYYLIEKDGEIYFE